MPATYDLGTAVGKVRLLVPDRDITNPVFQDEELEAFLSLEADDERRAAALALETIASDEALTQKVVRLLDLQTDGAKLSDSLLKRAASLRQQAAEAEAREDAGFDVAEMVYDHFSARERLIKQMLREGV